MHVLSPSTTTRIGRSNTTAVHDYLSTTARVRMSTYDDCFSPTAPDDSGFVDTGALDPLVDSETVAP